MRAHDTLYGQRMSGRVECTAVSDMHEKVEQPSSPFSRIAPSGQRPLNLFWLPGDGTRCCGCDCRRGEKSAVERFAHIFELDDWRAGHPIEQIVAACESCPGEAHTAVYDV